MSGNSTVPGPWLHLRGSLIPGCRLVASSTGEELRAVDCLLQATRGCVYLVYRLVSMVHVECLEMRRMGSMDDGGYELCTSPPFHFTPQSSSCLVYSFGSVQFYVALFVCLAFRTLQKVVNQVS